ncbi:MAG: sulfur carrier protein ThiS [Pirellulaceae bacterium]|jgi:sulfur carrier protein
MDKTLSNPMHKLTIEFNGQSFDVPPGTTIEQLLALAEIRSRLVAVEVNREIVPRALHASQCVAAGDTVEAVTLVGGG